MGYSPTPSTPLAWRHSVPTTRGRTGSSTRSTTPRLRSGRYPWSTAAFRPATASAGRRPARVPSPQNAQAQDAPRTERSGREARLARAAPGPLAGNDGSVEEQLAAPDAPRLTTAKRVGQAGRPYRAVPAQRLRPGHVLGRLGEEQIRIGAARQRRLDGEHRHGHVSSSVVGPPWAHV